MKNLYVTSVQSSIQLALGDFNFVSNPYCVYKGTKAKFNFDAVLLFDEEAPCFIKDNLPLIKNAGIPVIGSKRYNKLIQASTLHKLSIPHPLSYDIFGIDVKNDFCGWDIVLSELGQEQEIVLKAYNGARGIGQMKTTVGKAYKAYFSIMEDMNNDDPVPSELCKELEEERKLIKKEGKAKTLFHRDEKKTPLYCSSEGDAGNEGYLKTTLSGGNYFIQLYQSDIQKEYRILAFRNNKFLIVERKREDKKWQCERGGKYISDDITTVLKNEEINMLNKLLLDSNSPFLSIDVYLNKKGKMGIFEYQMEFGYHNSSYDINKLKNYMVESIKTMINHE